MDIVRVPDEQDEGGGLDRYLGDVVEDVRAALAAGWGIRLDDLPDLPVELARLDAPSVLGIDPLDKSEDLCDPLAGESRDEDDGGKFEEFRVIANIFDIGSDGAVVLFDQVPLVDDEDAGRSLLHGAP